MKNDRQTSRLGPRMGDAAGVPGEEPLALYGLPASCRARRWVAVQGWDRWELGHLCEASGYVVNVGVQRRATGQAARDSPRVNTSETYIRRDIALLALLLARPRDIDWANEHAIELSSRDLWTPIEVTVDGLAQTAMGLEVEWCWMIMVLTPLEVVYAHGVRPHPEGCALKLERVTGDNFRDTEPSQSSTRVQTSEHRSRAPASSDQTIATDSDIHTGSHGLDAAMTDRLFVRLPMPVVAGEVIMIPGGRRAWVESVGAPDEDGKVKCVILAEPRP